LKFTVGTTVYEFDESTDLKLEKTSTTTTDKSVYWLYAKSQTTHNWITLTLMSLPSQPLTAGDYFLTNPAQEGVLSYTVAEAWLSGVHYIDFRDDYANITISSIKNGLANGTFNARLGTYPASTLPKINVTNGEFRNVKIL
jgi:hypothetical protein